MVRLGYFRRVKLTFEIFSPVKIVTIFMCMFFAVLLDVSYTNNLQMIYTRVHVYHGYGLNTFLT